MTLNISNNSMENLATQKPNNFFFCSLLLRTNELSWSCTLLKTWPNAETVGKTTIIVAIDKFDQSPFSIFVEQKPIDINIRNFHLANIGYYCHIQKMCVRRSMLVLVLVLASISIHHRFVNGFYHLRLFLVAVNVDDVDENWKSIVKLPGKKHQDGGFFFASKWILTIIYSSTGSHTERERGWEIFVFIAYSLHTSLGQSFAVVQINDDFWLELLRVCVDECASGKVDEEEYELVCLIRPFT